MALIVKKFGGSSVATPEKMLNICNRVLAERKPDDKIVLVVSAMGDSTDHLLTLAEAVTADSFPREMDMLLATGEQVSIALMAMTFMRLGVAAVSYTGEQAGIKTTKIFNKARIKEIKPVRVQQSLNDGKIVIVAGFQGVTEDGDITTLGRGGSDTTAVGLAGALRADVCEIFTDVDGVYTADPRIVKKARKMNEITYDDMLEMARLGAVVMQPRAVEMGGHYGVDIHVRSTFTMEEGTIIRRKYTMMSEKEYVIRGVAHDNNVVKIVLHGVPDAPGVAFRVFETMAKNNIEVDMIVQSNRDVDTGKQDILFTVPRTDLFHTRNVLEKISAEIKCSDVIIEENMAKVSVVGSSMMGRPAVAAMMFGALAEADINVDVISTSEICISCLIHNKYLKEAVNAIHNKFFDKDDEIK
ncbi:MAG: aspartate kinase [Negativicutes bacterium]|jgi:aspartate kinase